MQRLPDIASIGISLALAMTLLILAWPVPEQSPEALERLADAPQMAMPDNTVAIPLPPPPQVATAPKAADPHPVTPGKPTTRRITPLPPEKPAPPVRSMPMRPAALAVGKNRSKAANGRTLLRLLEHGSGPAIEIAWPADRGASRRLFSALSACYGMVSAVMQRDGTLYRATGPRGRPWRPDMDRYSSFLRDPAGRSLSVEAEKARQIRSHHDLGRDSRPVRLFPRDVDARILGGLRRLAGQDYAKADRIRARYRLTPAGLSVTALTVDGRQKPGQVNVPPKTACREVS